jgi:hypothetical protein
MALFGVELGRDEISPADYAGKGCAVAGLAHHPFAAFDLRIV